MLLQDCRDTLTYQVNTGRTVVTSQLQENVRHIRYGGVRAACLPYSGIEKRMNTEEKTKVIAADKGQNLFNALQRYRFLHYRMI